MPQPRAYNRTKDFTENFGSETDHSSLNAELDAASNSVNDIRTNLAIIQADDGKLRAGAVTSDSISAELRTDLINGAAQGAADAAATANTKALEAAASATNAADSSDAAGESAMTASEWAQKTGAYVTSALASAKEWAVGTLLRGLAGGGSAKDWASYIGGTVDDAEYSAKKYAGDASTSAAQAADSAASIDPATLVRNTGNETIAGVKTFSDAPVIPYIGGMRVMGLTGNVNAATPLTKYDLSASMVTLRNAAGATFTRYTTGTITCDLGLAGAAANGRDQAGAFAANSWVYLYFIWNGSTLATIASLSATAPTLPTGYTHYAFATALRWNASSNIVPGVARGSSMFMDGAISVFNGTPAVSTETAMSLANVVPPNAMTFGGLILAELSASAVGANAANASIRHKSGSDAIYVRPHAGAAGETGVDTATYLLPNVGQNIFYFWAEDTANTSVRVLKIYVTSFTVQNGDA